MTGPYGQGSPYGAPGASPYGGPGQVGNPYGQPPSPYAPQQAPPGQGSPYAGNPYGQPPSPYAPQQAPAPSPYAPQAPGYYAEPQQKKGSAGKVALIFLALLVVAVGLGFVGFWFFGREKVLDNAAAAKDIQTILTTAAPNGYGADGISDVQCPATGTKISVKQGESFTCKLKYHNKDTTVTSKFTNDDGDYQVGAVDQP